MTQLNLSQLSFLVIDDNAFMRKLLRSMLNAFQVGEVQSASDGVDAFKLMKNGYEPDLIITDAKMPVMSGLEFTRWVRTTDEVKKNDIPIILVTAFTEAKLVRDARDAGVDEFLSKPVSADDLLRRIEVIVRKPRSFVRSGKYAGPDRRRKQVKIGRSDRRREDERSEMRQPLVSNRQHPSAHR